ncbi:MAG TPA: 4Fe-4S dicluster domain-containing protein [Thermoleophilia bacterium]|nr:4Fe-4S dicluster domain-containing protein [Thermoleophilia bacterium]
MTDQTDTRPDREGGDRCFIREADLRELTAELLAAGTEVIAPVAVDVCASPSAIASAACRMPGAAPIEIEYRALEDASDLDVSRGMPVLSLKSYFLPEHEALFCWRQHGTQIEMKQVATTFPPRVILGAKPCDSAALAIVDKVMNWDYEDELWNGRREATTIINMACPGIDESCFCTAVDLAPDSTKGADGLLTPVDGGYIFEATTDKGRAFASEHKSHFCAGSGGEEHRGRQADDERAAARARVAGNLEIDAQSVRDWIDTHFDDPLLAALGARCNGCGACTSVCPTCHCFDIIDEEEGVGKGTRRRCWDTCQAGKFTLHASGHNPRENQGARYRQRLNHKFAIYPLKFGEVLCTGCGRCTRVCHAGQDLVEILAAIDVAARRPGAPAETVEAVSDTASADTAEATP